MRRHAIDAAGIRRIEIAVLEAGWGLVCDPREKKYSPESIVDAQFSMPFGAAVAVVHAAAGLDQFTLDQIHSPRVRQMMSKVALVTDARLEESFPREWPARVTIELDSGERYEHFVRYPKGDPENPLTWDETATKFRALAGGMLPEDRCDRVIAQVRTGAPAGLPGLCR